MDIIKYISIVVPSIILVIIGISIKYYKAYWLISGYNTMSAEKKRNVDVKGLGKIMGNFCFLLAGLMFIFSLSLIFELILITITVAVIFVGSIIYVIIKSQKFDGNVMKDDGTIKKGAKIKIGAIITFLILVFLGVGILLYQSNKPTTYNITEQKIEISGLYGETVYFKDIVDISISDEIPKIILRTNGSAVGSSLKGYFKLNHIGKAKLFINTKIPTFIFIKTDKETIIFNSEDKAKTQEIFMKLKDFVKENQ